MSNQTRKVRYGDIYVCKDAIQRLLESSDPPIPAKTAIHIARFARRMSQEIALIEEQRVNLVRRLSKEKDGQFTVEAGTEEWREFIAEFTKLLNEEVDIDNTAVKIPDYVHIPIGDLVVLDQFIEIGES